MSEKLISADALREEMNEYILPLTENNLMGAADVFHRTVHLLEEAPAVDAVEVVRCSRCVNNPQIGTRTKGMVWCRKFRSEVRPDGFCSYGERREK